jgi:hypothetical protein
MATIPAVNAPTLQPMAHVIFFLLPGVVPGPMVDVGEHVTQQCAEHAVQTSGTQQAGDHIPGRDAPTPCFETFPLHALGVRLLTSLQVLYVLLVSLVSDVRVGDAIVSEVRC